MNLKKMKYWGHNGKNLINNTPDQYTNKFDWICCQDKIIMKKSIPKSIYIKTDYINKWAADIVKHKGYVLVVAGSDTSAQHNTMFPSLVRNSRKTFIENKIHTQNNVLALTVGLATHNQEGENLLEDVIRRTKDLPKLNKIFCCWRARSGQRESALDWVVNNELTCTWVYNEMDRDDFLTHVGGHRFTLCPVGGGYDPAPRCWEALMLGSVPIMLKKVNTKELYSHLPVLFVDKWEDINKELLNTTGDALFKKLERYGVKNIISIDYQISRIMRQS